MGTRRMQVVALLAIFCLAALPVRGDDKKGDVDEIGNRKVAHKSIISEEKEIAIGKQYSVEVERSAKLLTDPVINEYVNRVAQNVARNSDLKIPLTVKVIDDPYDQRLRTAGRFSLRQYGLAAGCGRGRSGGRSGGPRNRARGRAPLGEPDDQDDLRAIRHDTAHVRSHDLPGLYGGDGSLHERRAADAF